MYRLDATKKKASTLLASLICPLHYWEPVTNSDMLALVLPGVRIAVNDLAYMKSKAGADMLELEYQIQSLELLATFLPK
jgi:hypothetical protein